MGTKKQETDQTTRTRIAPRSAQENEILSLLQGIVGQSAEQLGGGLGITQQDRDLAAESLGATGDITRRQLEDFIRGANLNLDEQLSSRGIQGSSIESVQRGVIGREGVRQFANIASQERGQQAQLLSQLPFQRNQALLQNLGLGQFIGQFGLQERLAQGTTTGTGTATESGFSFADLASLGQSAGSLGAGGG